jgi:hypothetical protein
MKGKLLMLDSDHVAAARAFIVAFDRHQHGCTRCAAAVAAMAPPPALCLAGIRLLRTAPSHSAEVYAMAQMTMDCPLCADGEDYVGGLN